MLKIIIYAPAADERDAKSQAAALSTLIIMTIIFSYFRGQATARE